MAARATSDGAALESSARAFAAIGANLLAAESAFAAERSFARLPGGASPALRVAALGRRLLEGCEGAQPSTFDPHTGPLKLLTDREREVAFLAAEGLTSRTIADRLVLSVRTVDNHLAHAYTKLAVSGRSELGALLSPATPNGPAAFRS